MESDLSSKIIALLQTTFSSKDTEEIKVAEAELNNLSQNQQDYLKALLYIITTSHPYLTDKIKNSASLNLKKFVRQIIEGKSINSAMRESLARSIYNTIILPGIEPSIRSSLGYSLVPIFGSDISDTESSTLASLLPSIGLSLNENNAASIYGALKSVKAIYSVFTENPILLPIFKQLLNPLLAVGYKALEALKMSIETSNEQNCLESCEILHEWASTITSALEHFEITSRPSMAEIKDFSSLADLFGNILNFALPDNNLAQPSLISIATQVVHCKFNQTKSQILQGVNLILQFLIESKKKHMEDNGVEKVMSLVGAEAPDSPFLHMILTIIEPIVRSLHMVVSHPNYDNLLQTEYISDIVNEVLLILSKVSHDPKFSSFFLMNYKGIIVEILLPLLMSSSSDIDKFENSPEEFVSFSRDICESQESDIYKASASIFLVALAEKIDGALSFTVNFLSHLISMAITRSNPESDQYLSEFQHAAFLKASEEAKIETSLYGFCVLSYEISKRHDLLKIIEVVIGSHYLVFNTATEGLIQNRFCMLIHYYAEVIFYSSPESYNGLITILLKCCNPNTSPKAVTLQASETLSYMLQEESILFRLETLIPNIITTFIYLIPLQQNKGFFEAMQEIITGNTEAVFPHLDRLIPALVCKIQSEMQHKSESKKKKKSSIIIVKCWNIIRIIAEAKEMSKENVIELEYALLPLFNYMQNPAEIDFEDDIILFEVSLIRKCQAVSQVGWVLLNQLHLVQEKYEGTFIQLFPILNCYLFYGREYISENPLLIKKVIDMCKVCMFSSYKGKINEATNAEGALLIQQVLQMYPGMVDSYLFDIISTTLVRLNSNVAHDFFKARLLGVILTSFTYNCQLTFQILNSSANSAGESNLDYIITQILLKPEIFLHQYDRKIAALGLSTIITQEVLPQEINKKISEIFKALVEILSLSQNKSPFVQKKDDMMVEDGKSGDSSDDDIDSNIRNKMFKDIGTEEMEALLALTTYISPVLEIDEYENFRSLIKNFAQHSPTGLKSLLGKLSKSQVEELTNVLQCKKVQLTGFSLATADVRRIVRPKKHLISSNP